MIEISYLTEITKPYIDGLNKCNSQKDLKEFITDWKQLAYDAFEQIYSLDFSYSEYQKGCELERKGKYSGDEWVGKYGAILLPGVMMFISLQAEHFHAPEGTVFIRMRDLKVIKKRSNGIYYLDIPKKEIING